MTFYCTKCRRSELDVMVDGLIEMNNGQEICSKCAYGEWTEAEMLEMERRNMWDDACGNHCECRGTCAYCLAVESLTWGC